MSDSHEPSTVVDASNPQVVERRRTGRIANVSPALIPLLRGSDVLPDSEEYPDNAMAPARGIVFGVLISVLFWAILIWIV